MNTRVQLLSVGLLLGLALSPAWGQRQGHEAVGVQGHQPSGQPRADASDIPVALAPEKTLENFIVGITLYVDQPVRVGAFCRFGGTVGTVEEVGLHSTRVRTLDRTVVTVPNAEFSSLQIENFVRRDRIWYHPTIHLHYETTPDQNRYILVEVHRMLYAHPKVDPASAHIRLVGFGDCSLTLEDV